MEKRIELKKLGNHWYPSINHQSGYIYGFNKKIDRYLNIVDNFKLEELTLVLTEVGVIVDNYDIIIFDERDITRYLTTNDSFDLHFVINNHNFTIKSELCYLLETQCDFKFYENLYRVDIY